MTESSFSLIPFPDQYLPNIKITGLVTQKNNILNASYTLTGEVSTILFPETSTSPARKDELWKATCFEFFLSIPNQPQYWEFNMSPSGDWNAYKMDTYRRVGFQEESRIEQLPFSVKHDADHFSLTVSVDLQVLFPETTRLQLGITSVIQTNSHHETYWALVHPGIQPDFHLRESFCIEV